MEFMKEAFDDNEFLSEKIELEESVSKIEFELNDSLEDFEKVSIDKLNEINDLIKDMEPTATIYNGQFYEDYVKLKVDFNFFVSTFEEVKRFKVETTLEDFLNVLELLKKDLFE